MDLRSMVKTQVQFAQLGQTSQAGSSASLAPANKRLSQQIDTTNVKLSAYGQISSAFGTAKTAASGLTAAATSKTASNSDVVKAAQAFVDSYNKAAQAVGAAVTSTSTKSGALVTDSRATTAASGLARSLTSSAGLSDLKQTSITKGTDGTLTLDTKALEQSLQSNSAQAKSALANIGQKVETSTSRELTSTGNIGGSISSLTNQSQTLSAQQMALQQQVASVQALLDQSSNILNYSASNGIAAYQKLLSG